MGPSRRGDRPDPGQPAAGGSAIAPRGKATVELIKLGVKTVAESGADGLSFAFYDGANMQYLRAIREAMEEAEITLAAG